MWNCSDVDIIRRADEKEQNNMFREAAAAEIHCW